MIGAALQLLTDSTENQQNLKTSLGSLIRVMDAVDWKKISKDQPDAWLYFYEEFLSIYDNSLRRQTGSYYTPPEVVSAMVAMVDEALSTDLFGVHRGLASPSITIADPATGTGTFILGVLRCIAQRVQNDEGAGAVPSAIRDAINRIIAFEIQLGPFAVAQLRILAEVLDLTKSDTKSNSLPPLRMFVADTLANPYDDAEWIPTYMEAIGKSRKEANKIKREASITVVIGNPPYKEKAKGRGGWVEQSNPNAQQKAPLEEWMPPSEWRAGVHSKHLRNLYVYFWRWATWKVFDHNPNQSKGIVCFITAAGFLAGPGFQKMRDYLRRTCDDIWVIDCSPEGNQPEVSTRIFQDAQRGVCIVMVARSKKKDLDAPASVRFRVLPAGAREIKFQALKNIHLDDSQWLECPSEWRAPFLPKSKGDWSTYPALEDFFIYNGSGVMPGRTWIIAPDSASLADRWAALKSVPVPEMDDLFQQHMNGEKLGDHHSNKILKDALHGFPIRLESVADDKNAMVPPVRYGFRSFDRQWVIPDKRLINRPNPEIWRVRSNRQIFITSISRTSPTSGPGLTFTALIPDLDHYSGRGGRAFPIWANDSAKKPNLPPALLSFLGEQQGVDITAEDFIAYIAAVAAHPAYTARFQKDLSTPGLRIPLTAETSLFKEAVQLGKRVLWLHTFGERLADKNDGRPKGPPRLAEGAPTVPKDGTISDAPDEMPDSIGYDAAKQRLLVGHGFIDNVPPVVWKYEVSGKQVLHQWFSSRKRDREKPIIGDRRQPSLLGSIQPDHWLPEYTTELLNVINVLALLVELEPKQEDLLDRICACDLISETELRDGGALNVPITSKGLEKGDKKTMNLFPGRLM